MIVSEHVRLRAVEKDDLPHFQEWLNDEEVSAGLTVVLPLSMVDEDNWFETMRQSPPEEHGLAIDVFEADTWIVVGGCGLHALDYRVRSAELAIFIGEKSRWNQGIGTQVMRMLLKYCFDTLNLNRVYLRVFENNPRAIRSYERAGFIHEGRMRQAMYKNGQYLDVLLMSVLRQEWEARTKEIEE